MTLPRETLLVVSLLSSGAAGWVPVASSFYSTLVTISGVLLLSYAVACLTVKLPGYRTRVSHGRE